MSVCSAVVFFCKWFLVVLKTSTLRFCYGFLLVGFQLTWSTFKGPFKKPTEAPRAGLSAKRTTCSPIGAVAFIPWPDRSSCVLEQWRRLWKCAIGSGILRWCFSESDWFSCV